MPNQTKTNPRRQPRPGGAGILQMCRRFTSQMTASWQALTGRQTFIGRRTAIILASLAVVGLFGLTSALLIAADFTADSYAVNGASLDSEVRVDVDGNYYVSLAASDAAFSVAPGAGTQSSKTQVNLSVETNALGGAGLYLSMSGSTNALFLDGNTASTSKNIAAATAQTTYNNMASNTWGYSTDDVNFQGVPTADSPTLLADVDGVTVGTSSEGVTSATIPVYYAAKVDTSIPSGSYANSVTYLAVVDGGITTSATLTKITVDNQEVDELQADKTNVILVTTNLKTKPYGTPRVYYKTTDPSGYAECGDVVVSSNEAGYMIVQCSVTPTQAATGVTLHIIPKGSASDVFCTDGTYPANSSQCEKGEWRWGEFTVALPNIDYAFGGITTMQEMTPGICDETREGETVQLKDVRDDKIYWVAKLPDGNCWMVQNLDLDLSTQTVLTPTDSNVPSNWRPSVGTITTIPVYNEDSGKSYNPGDVYYENTNGEDPHYHVGNYYQWSAATAGYTDTSQASQSICPKGWTLPSPSHLQSLSSSISIASDILSAPYYFLRGGHLYSSRLVNSGEQGYYWSSSSSHIEEARILSFGQNWQSGQFVIQANGPSERSLGSSVRCVSI